MSNRYIIAIAMIPILIGLLIYLFIPPASYAPTLNDKGLKTAVWMGVTWSMDKREPDDIRQLADDLIARQVDDVYVYVSYLKAGDFFNPTYDHAQEFVVMLKQFAPDIRVFGWVGVPISIFQPGGTYVANRLENLIIRQQIAEFSHYVVTDLGFDGIHLNAELIPNQDKAFLGTLALIRDTLPDVAFFSTTAHALRLDQQLTASPYPEMAHHWDIQYFRQVAGYVDQIALMSYDSGLSFPRDFLDWMTYQVTASQQALLDTGTELMIGLPTSEEWTPSHQTQAETLALAIDGMRNGYNGRVDGIAIYPYWETDFEEWQTIISNFNP